MLAEEFPIIPHMSAGVDCCGCIVPEVDGDRITLKCNECGATVGEISARGATRRHSPQTALVAVSIHAPRAGSDGCKFSSTPSTSAPLVSIHAPRAGSDDDVAVFIGIIRLLFQSTLPARGATLTRCQSTANSLLIVLIHAPRAGSDAAGADFIKRG